MRILVKLNYDGKMDMKSSFESKRAFSQSSLWELAKELNCGGHLDVTYAPGYKNSFDFVDSDHLRRLIDISTERELVNAFTGA